MQNGSTSTSGGVLKEQEDILLELVSYCCLLRRFTFFGQLCEKFRTLLKHAHHQVVHHWNAFSTEFDQYVVEQGHYLLQLRGFRTNHQAEQRVSEARKHPFLYAHQHAMEQCDEPSPDSLIVAKL